ncbi:uncharacterized protein LOC108914977 [Anoplophora glabripennis]|uniref:uncharacterized protein LOC108914977 n=1 Tax=Anoplophora glabripennis TaxID=217634 RepID=UPI00087366A0|nr:uncharacterized protein LOC108914977 [Anoplophora glabripennis]
MTMGYFITDLDSMVTLLIGVMRSKRVCRILEKLSKLDSSIAKDKELKTNVTRVTLLVLLYLGVKIGSFLHSALFLSTFKSGLFSMSCSCLGSPIAVLVRGITVVFPTVEIAIVYMFVVLVEAKFEYLAESVAITIENMGGEKDSCGLIYIKTPTAKKETQSLDRLAVMHLEIFSVVSEINYCTGFQLLIGHCSSLYTMIYYLYRYITFTIDRYTTRSSRLYYVPSLFYRLVKIIGYMILGQRFHTKSLLPLKTLQRIRITNLPSHVQQQIQTLMMQWNDKKAYLTAWGIVNFGPWLLAPIAGNIITYLLVALQFDDTSIEDANATLAMQSMI